MNMYLSASEAVIDLHGRGFIDDFELFGDHVLWVQKKVFLIQDEFLIVECHRFLDAHGIESIIFGLVSVCFRAKGILMSHYKEYSNKTPAIIERKLEKLFSLVSGRDGNYSHLTFKGDF